MELYKVRRLAARILKVGETRVRFNPAESVKIAECMTKEDVRALIADGLIKKKRLIGMSRGRAKAMHTKRKKGRKRGYGKRAGTKKARMQSKSVWVRNVRAQRKMLAELKKGGVKMEKPYSTVYKMVKGNYFRGKKYLEAYVRGGGK
ncbi:MAG: 50S ribosomal protein L19e [Candidatus Diapherotrites archaeon]